MPSNTTSRVFFSLWHHASKSRKGAYLFIITHTAAEKNTSMPPNIAHIPMKTLQGHNLLSAYFSEKRQKALGSGS
ncbi:hypothetical protein HY250_00905 [Candidatus Azambacteria bacterium]|nr:hypothetical protein [Candidatus Azambacteria bacterium]